jgi:hypothetical protein
MVHIRQSRPDFGASKTVKARLDSQGQTNKTVKAACVIAALIAASFAAAATCQLIRQSTHKTVKARQIGTHKTVKARLWP